MVETKMMNFYKNHKFLNFEFPKAKVFACLYRILHLKSKYVISEDIFVSRFLGCRKIAKVG